MRSSHAALLTLLLFGPQAVHGAPARQEASAGPELRAKVQASSSTTRSSASPKKATSLGQVSGTRLETSSGEALRGATEALERPVILDAEGRTLVLRGINLGNKAPPYLPPVQEADFARMADWGLNTIRFLILWAAIEPEPGVYDTAWLQEVEPYLDLADAYGLKVILDMHQDVYGEMFNHDGAAEWACPEELVGDFQNTPLWYLDYLTPQVNACFSWFWETDEIQDHFVEAWRLAAEMLGNHPAVLGFDLFNEPWPGFNLTPRFEPEQLQPFYERLIPVLQAEVPEAYIFFEPWVFRDYFVPTFLEPFDLERLVYFPHYYNLSMETTASYHGQGHAVQHWVGRVQADADRLGVPFAVGEYGGSSAGVGIEALLEDVNAGLERANTGGMYWEYCRGDNNYCVLNGDGSEKPQVVGPLVRVYPDRVAGRLKDASYQSASRRFDLHYEVLSTTSWPTELRVPARLYPTGFRVLVSQPSEMRYTWDSTRGILSVYDSGPAGAARTVSVEAM